MPVFFTFFNTRIWLRGIKSSSFSWNYQTYLHAPGCYNYRNDVYENFQLLWFDKLHIETDLVWF